VHTLRAFSLFGARAEGGSKFSRAGHATITRCRVGPSEADVRKFWIIAGVVLLILGLVLAVVPVPSQSVGTPSVVAPEKVLVIHDQAPLDVIEPSISYSITWNASPSTSLGVWSCGSDASCANVSGSSIASVSLSAGGTFTFSGKANQYYGVVNLGNGTATISVSYSGPFVGAVVGWAVLIIGVLLIVTGVLLAPPTPPSPSGSVEPWSDAEPTDDPGPAEP
jgi:uncharacterized membrane protein